MNQSTAIWLVILLALITANLPFILQRPLLALPWALNGEPQRPAVIRIIESTAFFALLIAIAVVFYGIIGSSVVFASNVASVALFYGKIAAFILCVGALIYYVGWRSRKYQIEKSVLARFLELFVLFMLCGVLALALELNQGNRFPQGWEFFAITGSLYLVMGYPGFVGRYLMRKRRR